MYLVLGASFAAVPIDDELRYNSDMHPNKPQSIRKDTLAFEVATKRISGSFLLLDCDYVVYVLDWP